MAKYVKEKEDKQLIDEGYTQADLDLAERMSEAYGMSKTDYLHKYAPRKESVSNIPSKPRGRPSLKTPSDCDVSLTKPKVVTPSSTGTTVIAVPGTAVVDIETSSITLMHCTNATTGKYVTCAVLNNTPVDTKFTDASGRPVFIINDVLYNVLVQLLYGANYRVQEAEKDASIARTEANVYKTLVDTLRSNGVID